MTNTPDVKVELLPCPFCGGYKARTIHIRDGRKVACICGACGKPEFHGPIDRPSAEDRAIAAWNTRLAASSAQVGAGILYDDAAIDAVQRLLEQGKAMLDPQGYLILTTPSTPALDREALAREIEQVFAEDVIEQAHRLDVRPGTVETPGNWMMRVRKSALLAALSDRIKADKP